MSIQISERLSQVKPSPTLAITARAGEMRAQGKQVISLSVGEPDFDTPDHIKQAAIEAINSGFSKYTPVDGIPELKQAIIDKFARENGLVYNPKQIIVSTGAKQNLYNICQAVLNKGDEAIIPAPYWVSYPAMVLLGEAVPVVINTDIQNQFKIQPEELRAAITPKTRMFFINSPSNPSGMAYTKEELAALGKVLAEHPQILVVSDDIYEHVMWENTPFVNIVNACPALKDQTVVVNGLSKAFSMTGWRLGYAAGPENVTAACKKIQSQSTSNPCSITQKAGVAGLNGGLDSVQDMVAQFKKRHDMVVAGLNAIDGFECLSAQGTFYAFPNVSGAIKHMGLKDDVQFAEKLLVDGGVASVPGTAFGMPGYIRFSYALDEQTLKTALESIEKVVRAS